MSPRVLRIAALLVVVPAGLAAIEITRLTEARGGWSALTVLMLVAIALGTAAILALACGPCSWRERAARPIRRLADYVGRQPLPDNRRAGAALVAMGGLTCLVLLGRLLALPQDPWDDDQGAYLITASQIREHGGAAMLLRDLWRGDFAEANRHPLYLALLSFQPTLESGRRLSAGIGVVTLVLLTGLLARRRGWLVAGVFCVLLSTNLAFLVYSTRVVCEVLVVLCSGCIWLLTMTRGLSHDPTAGGRRWGALESLVTGGLLGLTWLAKGTGLLLLLGYLGWLAWEALRCGPGTREPAGQPRQTTRSGWLLCGTLALSAFLIVSSPLLVRNVRRFGQPFYNVNSLLQFSDRYEDFDDLIESGTTTSEAARRYLATHSVGQILTREASGLVWELFIILRSLGPAPLDDSRILFGVPLALVALAVACVDRGPQHRLLLTWGLLHWLIFAWYVPIAAGERFILPLLVPILVTAADSLVRLAHPSTEFDRKLPGLAAVWCIGWAAFTCLSPSLAGLLD